MMIRRVVSLVLPLTIVLTLPAFPVYPTAHAGTGGELRGPAFSDPSHRLSMPEGWGEKPIVYEKWAAGADLAVTLDQHLYGALLPFIQDFAAGRGVRIAVKEGTCGISADLRQALDKVKTLSGLLPICYYCNKIRSDEGYWEQLETYIQEHSSATLSHGICDDCMTEHFPQHKGKEYADEE